MQEFLMLLSILIAVATLVVGFYLGVMYTLKKTDRPDLLGVAVPIDSIAKPGDKIEITVIVNATAIVARINGSSTSRFVGIPWGTEEPKLGLFRYEVIDGGSDNKRTQFVPLEDPHALARDCGLDPDVARAFTGTQINLQGVGNARDLHELRR